MIHTKVRYKNEIKIVSLTPRQRRQIWWR